MSRTMLSGILSIALVLMPLPSALLSPAGGHLGSSSVSSNATKLAQVPLTINGQSAEAADFAAEGNTLVAAAGGRSSRPGGLGIFRLFNRSPYIKQVGSYSCGSALDVSVYQSHAFISLQDEGADTEIFEGCNNTDNSAGRSGIRIVDISDPRYPRQVKFISHECGSHTHTLFPRGDVTYLYISSLCTDLSSERLGTVSILKFPTTAPSKASLVGEFDISPSVYCHDITILASEQLALAACPPVFYLWDLSNPEKPVTLSILIPPSTYQPFSPHGGAFSWDGRYVVVSDESADGCSETDKLPNAALWIYDIQDRYSPKLLSYRSVPRRPDHTYVDKPTEHPEWCGTHYFNVVPTKDPNQHTLVSSYYAAGWGAVDFSDPLKPREIAHYMGSPTHIWSAYWYNGLVYSSEWTTRTGIGVYDMTEALPRSSTREFKTRMNPQVQEADFDP